MIFPGRLYLFAFPTNRRAGFIKRLSISTIMSSLATSKRLSEAGLPMTCKRFAVASTVASRSFRSVPSPRVSTSPQATWIWLSYPTST